MQKINFLIKKSFPFVWFFFLLSLTTLPSIVRAEAFDTNLGQFQGALKSDKLTKETFDFQTVIGVSSSLYTLLAGCKTSGCPQSLSDGAVYKVGDAIAGLYSVPPASGVYYAIDTLKRFNLVQPVYAQEAGTGFAVLQPFLNFWRAVRNMVYALFVIGAVILGFAVMFRTRVSPQVVITIQSALPRLVIGLLLVTFSYAIVGLLIDLTYVVVGLFIWGLSGANLTGYNAENYFNDYLNAGFGQTIGFIIGSGIGGFTDIITGTFRAAPAVGVSVGLSGLVATALVIFTPGVGAGVGAALILVGLGLVIAILFFLIRILFTLARAYIMLLIYLVFGPLFILWDAVIGRGIWEGWLRGVIANLVVFPVVGIVIFLADVLIRQIGGIGMDVWGPPYVGNQYIVLQGIVALGAIFLLSQIPDIINQLLGIRMPRVEGPDIGRRFEPVSRATSEGIQRRIRERGQDEPFFQAPNIQLPERIRRLFGREV